MKPEKISKGEFLSMGYLKKVTSKLRRREIKQFLRGNRKVMPNDKQFLGETL